MYLYLLHILVLVGKSSFDKNLDFIFIKSASVFSFYGEVANVWLSLFVEKRNFNDENFTRA